MNSETVKPIPPTAATPQTCARRMSAGSVATPSRSAANVAAPMPSSLPATSAIAIAHATRLLQRVRQDAAAEAHARVGEREQRHDHERARHVQAAFEQRQDVAPADLARRGQQPERDARDRRVHAGLVDGQPDRDAEHRVGRDPRDAGAPQRDDSRDPEQRSRQPRRRQVARVEQRR